MQPQIPVHRIVQWVTWSCGLACVYLQSSAVSTVLADALLPPLPAEPGIDRTRPRNDTRRAVTNAALLANNPFDWRIALTPPSSVDAAEGDAAARPSTVDLSNPLHAEVCGQIRVSIVTELPDPRESTSVMFGADDQTASAFRVGDRIDDYEVAYIGFNRVKASPAVWLVSETKLCQTLLFGPLPTPSEGAPGEHQPLHTGPAAKQAHSSALSPELAEGITRISDTQVAVERAVVDQVLRDPSVFMRAARIVPMKDQTTGGSTIRLTGVRDGSLLSTLNLKNGDQLTSINGFDLSSPEQALNAYARLRTADKLSLEITRQGKPVTLQVNIE